MCVLVSIMAFLEINGNEIQDYGIQDYKMQGYEIVKLLD